MITVLAHSNSPHQFFLAVASCAGLFKPFEDSIGGYWLNQERALDYYDIKSGDTLAYKTKKCPLRVKTLDGSIKTLLIDESQTVAELTKAVCQRIGTVINGSNKPLLTSILL